MHWRGWRHARASSVEARNLRVVFEALSIDSNNNAAACACWNRTHHVFLPGCLPSPVKRTAASLTVSHRRLLHPAEQPYGAGVVNVLAEPLRGGSRRRLVAFRFLAWRHLSQQLPLIPVHDAVPLTASALDELVLPGRMQARPT